MAIALGIPGRPQLVVVNAGNEPAPATSLAGTLCLPTDTPPWFMDCDPSLLDLGSVPALDPGESTTIISAPYTFSSLTLDPGLAGGLVPGLPDNGLVYLIAYVTTPIGVGAATVEVSIENNGGGASATYPTGPADPSYDVSSDGDQDGWEPGSPPDGDCNDANPAVHPGVPEIPNNGIDEDCTGGDAPPLPSSGEEVPGWDLQPGYEDDDGDGYPANTNYYGTPIPNDCNDGSATTHPGAEEIEDEFDNDCDGLVDEGYTSIDWQTLDFDGDGYGVQDGDCNDFSGGQIARRPSKPMVSTTTATAWSTRRSSSPIGCDRARPQPKRRGIADRGGGAGLFYEVTLENVGESLGPDAVGFAGETVEIRDLAGEVFAVGPQGFIPYSAFPDPAYAATMVCSGSGLIAILPAGGIYGETNTVNNWVVGMLPDGGGSDRDLVAATPSLSYDNGDQRLVISGGGHLEGECPASPPGGGALSDHNSAPGGLGRRRPRC